MNGLSCSDNKENSELRKKSIRFSKALNLIRLSDSRKQYELDEKGILAIQDGGIEKYLSNIRKDKDLDNSIKEYTLESLQGNIFQIKYWWLIALISFLASMIISNLGDILKWLD